MNQLKLILIGISVAGGIAATIWVQNTFSKLKERKALVQENKVLKTNIKTLHDSLQLHKEWLAKSLVDTKNASELYTLTKGMTASFQSVITEMRDSVIKINKDRIRLEAKVLELQKDLERTKRKRKFL